MNNTIIIFLWTYNTKRILKQAFYRLDLKLWQFVLRAIYLEIDFRKLVCDGNDSSYKSTCTNEITVDGKRSPRGRELAYKLERGASKLTGLGWCTRPGCAFTGWAILVWCWAIVGLAIGLVSGCGGWLEWEKKRKERGEKEKRKGRERKRRGKTMRKKERERRGEKKERKGILGFSGFETRIYSVFDFSKNVLFLIVLRRNFNF